MAEIYKKFKQSDRLLKRSVDVNETERSQINSINDKFIQLFKNKHLS